MGIFLTGKNFLEGDILHTILFQTLNPSKKYSLYCTPIYLHHNLSIVIHVVKGLVSITCRPILWKILDLFMC